MSLWEKHELEAKVVAVLGQVRRVVADHPFGEPYVSAYQLAIAVERAYPGTADALGKPLGGAGGGQRDSLTQYLANELAKRIRDSGDTYPVQAAFLSNQDADHIVYTRPDGKEMVSSLVDTGYFLSVFRLRR